MYEYKVAEIIKVYDGDTITAKIDLGFGIFKVDHFRLLNLNAPEVRGEERPEGLISRDYLRERLYEPNINITVKTTKDKKGKYGRYIAEIFVDGVNINKELIEKGLAEYKVY